MSDEILQTSVLDLLRDGVILTDLSSNILFVSKLAQETYGYADGELVGRPISLLYPRYDLAELARSTKPDFEADFVRKDGEKRRAIARVSFRRDGAGTPIGYVFCATDITEWKSAERALGRRLELDALLGRISTDLIAVHTLDMSEKIQKALGGMCGILGTSLALACFFSADKTRLPSVIGWSSEGMPPQVGQLAAAPSSVIPWLRAHILGNEILRSMPVAELPGEAETEKKLLAQSGIRYVTAVPIVLEGSVSGFIAFGSASAMQPFNDDEINLIKTCGGLFLGGLLARYNTDMLRYNARLLDQITEAVVATNRSLFISKWNHAAETIFGYTEKEMIGRHLSFLYCGTPQQFQDTVAAPLLRIGSFRTDAWLRRKSGDEFWADISLTLERDDEGEITTIVCSATDISERKRTEEALGRRLLLDELMAEISTALVGSRIDMDLKVQAALGQIAGFVGMDLGLACFFSSDKKSIPHAIGWCPDGIPPQVKRLWEAPSATIPWIRERILREEVVVVASIPDLPSEANREKELFAPSGIHSFFAVPVSFANNVAGFLAFGARTPNLVPHDYEIAFMQTCGGIFINALLRRYEGDLARFQAQVINQIHEAVVVTNEMAYVTNWNNAAEKIFGYSSEEALEQHLAFVYPRGVDGIQEDLLEPLLRQGSLQTETRMRKKSGEEFDASLSFALSHDANGDLESIICSATDITERKRGEQALRESEERLKLVIEGSNDAFWDWDLANDVIEYDRHWSDMLGYDYEAMVSGQLEGTGDMIHPDDLQNMRQALLDHMSGLEPYYEAEYRIRTKSGEWKWILDRGKVVRWGEQGNPTRITGTHRDISENKREEEERRKIDVSMLQAQKLESLGVLAGGIAHDFNNLLMGILGNAGLVLMDLPPESPAVDGVRQIETAAHRAADLARQMLAYSGRGAVVKRSVNLNDVVEEMAHLLEVSISKSCSLTYHFVDQLPAVEADPTQIRQVVMNLITNASEAIGDRSGTVTISTGVKSVGPGLLSGMVLGEEIAPGPYVFVEVSDTGSGMDAETVSRIFEPFFSTKFTGRGLGLAAVLGIVRSHAGAIRVSSQPGRGTTITVLLPANAAGSAHPNPRSESSETSTPWKGEGMLLVVDDEEIVRDVAKSILERLGFTVLTAADGVEAVETFRQHEAGVRAVILDMTMPRMGGLETCDKLREIRPDVPVILSSGYNEQETTAAFSDNSLAGYVQKPYTPQILAEKMRDVLRQ